MASQNAGVSTVLGPGSVFEGKLAFEGTVHINGIFTGEIHSKDTLVVGEGAKVKGTVVTPAITIERGVVFEGTSRMENLDAVTAPAPAPRPAKVVG